jgi:hypothetical protein
MALIVPHAQLLSIKYLFNPPLYLALAIDVPAQPFWQ